MLGPGANKAACYASDAAHAVHHMPRLHAMTCRDGLMAPQRLPGHAHACHAMPLCHMPASPHTSMLPTPAACPTHSHPPNRCRKQWCHAARSRACMQQMHMHVHTPPTIP